VAVYGHGLTVSKETMGIVAAQNAAAGVATIGIDVPNHGGRQAGQGGHLLDLTKPSTLGRLVGIPVQGTVDHVSLVEAVKEHLGDLDLAPWNPFGDHGDGRPDLDTSLLLYEGTSMGGVLGTAEYALIPDFDAAFLQVPGVGIIDILSHSALWPVFEPIIPDWASAGDAAALLGASTMLLDRGDATHLLDDLRASGRPFLAQIGYSDSIVPEFSSDRLVRLLDLPRIGTQLTDIRASGQVDELPPDGRGFLEVWPQSFGFMGHLTAADLPTRELLEDWLEQRLTRAGLGTP
jgi:hypothetical protein